MMTVRLIAHTPEPEKVVAAAAKLCYSDAHITDLLDGRDDIDNSMVFISSCQPKPGCMEAIKAGLRRYGKFENIIETDIGTTIGGYSGPGTIGIVFAKKV